MPQLYVVPARMGRWTDNFVTRHGAAAMNVVGGALVGFAQDGSYFEARLPYGRAYDGPARTEDFAAAAVPPDDWGLLLVRKGGFAVARVAGEQIARSKVGHRHVQGRSKAGGWSQQRFARRRENQASRAYAAAASYAEEVLEGCEVLVAGGDHLGLDHVLGSIGMREHVVDTLTNVPEPRRGVFESAVIDARSVKMSVTNA